MRTFLVPTDFSAPSAKALETAEWISEHVHGAEVFLFHACHLPSSIYYDGLAGSNMVDLLREAAEEQMEEFKEKYQSPKSRVIVNAKADRSVARTVAESASDIPADMVLIGGKGRSGLTGALIGSVTESLLQAVEDVPVWVVKTAHKRQLQSKSPDSAAKSRA
jgi:nucleotide-binding universal stress UspA family protein